MTNSGDEKNLQPMYVNTSAPDDGNLSPGESDSPVTMENGKVVIRKHRKNITYPDIAQCFDMPIRDAAQILGISLTQLKRLCREFNIPRWPYRRLNSIQRRIEVLTIMLERNNQTGGDDRTARDTRDEMRKLQEEARSIKEDPTIVTKQGLDIDGCSSSTFTIQNDNTPTTQYNMMSGQLQMYGQDNKHDFDDMMGKQGQRLVVKYPGAKDSPVSKKRKNTSTKGGKKKKAKNGKNVKEEDDDDDDDNFDDTPKQQQMQQPSPIMQSLQQPSQNQQYQDSTQPPLIMMIDPLYNPNITSSRRRQAPTPTPPMHQMNPQQIKRQSPPTPPVNMIPNQQQQQPQRITTSMGPRLSDNSLLSFMNSNNGSTGSIGMHMNSDRIPSPPRLAQQQYNQPMMNRNNGYNNMGMLPSLQNPNYEEQQFQQPTEAAQNGYLPNQLLRFDVASVQDMDNSARRDSTDGDILRKFSVSSLFDRRQSSIGDLFSSDDATPSSANLTSQQDSVGSVGSLLSPMRGSSVGTFDSSATQSDGTDLMRVLQQNYGQSYNNGSFFPQATQAAPDNSRFHTS